MANGPKESHAMDPETPEWPLEGPCAVFGSGDCKRIPIVMPRRP